MMRFYSRPRGHVRTTVMHRIRVACLIAAAIFSVTSIASQSRSADAADSETPPNIIVIFCDDLGYADVGPFGSKLHRTPAIDRMAREGMRLTSFYAAPVCTPSRASLMTGCYPKRVGLPRVLFPKAPVGISADELTLPEVLKAQGYATACVGKWHLGDQPQFLPTRHGFDRYFGLPYSNDMWPGLDNTPLGKAKHAKNNYPPLPLMRDDGVERAVLDQAFLVEAYVNEALAIIDANKDRPFFLYLPHTAVHLPLYPGERFRGKSKNGAYGDWVEEIDWGVGQILDALEHHGIDDNTLVLFTSDNGPSGGAAGSAEPLRGRKGSTFEGGMREPCVVRWPGKIAPGTTCDEVTSTMDLLPTFARLAGGSAPSDRTIDGHDIWPLLSGEPGAKSEYEAFFYYKAETLAAVRSGPWKLHVPSGALYHLQRDIGESTDVAAENPRVVARLTGYIEAMRSDVGDGQKHPGSGCRPSGRVEAPEFLIPRPDEAAR